MPLTAGTVNRGSVAAPRRFAVCDPLDFFLPQEGFHGISNRNFIGINRDFIGISWEFHDVVVILWDQI